MNRISKRALAGALSLTLVLAAGGTGALAAEESPVFTDIQGHYAQQAVERWSGYGLIAGYGSRFAPDDVLTRGQMAVILAKLLALPQGGGTPFADVEPGEWYTDAIGRCYRAELLAGSGGLARPNDPVTREQAMVMLCKALAIDSDDSADLSGYADGDRVSEYARGSVAAMLESGYVSGTGNGNISPQKSVTRGAFLTILNRAVAIYAVERNATIDAVQNTGLILVAEDNVTIRNAPKGTKILVAKGISSTRVNGKGVTGGSVYYAEEQSSSAAQ